MEKNLNVNKIKFDLGREEGIDNESIAELLPLEQTEKKKYILAELLLVLFFMIFISGFTLVILLIGWISLRLRKKSWKDLGFWRPDNWSKFIRLNILFAVLWAITTLFVILPVLSLITGAKIDLSIFTGLSGDYAALLLWLVMSWTLAAFGEEFVYRGYLQNRIVDLIGDNKLGWSISILFISGLFGIAHIYQGTVGVISVFLTAIVYSLIYLKFKRNLWAAILAHGFFDTFAFLTIFFFGPALGLL
ncbi:MAG: CPBP family intramembrane glutamic endopeptidase [Candidatus Hodarchaeales archaeon]